MRRTRGHRRGTFSTGMMMILFIGRSSATRIFSVPGFGSLGLASRAMMTPLAGYQNRVPVHRPMK